MRQCTPKAIVALSTLHLEQNVLLARYTTLRIGGPARWFATARSEEQVREAVRLAEENLRVPLFVLGGGSNLLISDGGFDGLVLHIHLQGIEVEPAMAGGNVLVRAAAGTSWDDLVQFTVDRNLAGMECLAGIPGTTGGTPVQNVGAYGQEVSQTISAVRCFDTHLSTVVELSSADCGFAYRTSLFNTTKRGRYIVLRVDFLLREGGAPNLRYADLKRVFDGKSQPTLAEVAEAVRIIRRAKGMVVDAADPDSRSAGSFFRNPIVPASHLSRIASAANLPENEVPHWPAGGEAVKLPAAWLLEHAGFTRGTILGNAGISSKHTLALINRGHATCADIADLREKIIAGVAARFGITLEQEPVSVGTV